MLIFKIQISDRSSRFNVLYKRTQSIYLISFDLDHVYSSTAAPEPTTTDAPWPTTRWPTEPTTHQPWTTSTPKNEHCYGHFTYKEDHNIIIDGEDDRHKNANECEFVCSVSKADTFRTIKIYRIGLCR